MRLMSSIDLQTSRFTVLNHEEAAPRLGADSIIAAFSTEEAARKLLYLFTEDILHKWTGPIFNWPLNLNQLAIRYEDRLSF